MNQDGKKIKQIPRELCSIEDYRKLAKEFIEPKTWEYLDSGSGDDITAQKNTSAFDTIEIWSRVLSDLREGHTRCVIGDLKLAHPILLGPVAHQKLFDPEGELATAQAAEATDTLMVTSTLASCSMESITNINSALSWFQLYWQNDRSESLTLLKRAEKAGYKAIVVTVDVPINGLRRRAQRAGFSVPDFAQAVNIKENISSFNLKEGESEVFQGLMNIAPTWQDLDWLISKSNLPVFIKGIIHPQDAQKAKQIGATGVVVSNHGGRALDTTPSTLSVLPAIRQSVGEDYCLLMDGGIRQGGDVFKAIALGADAVLIGRPQIYGLAVAGALGVAHIIKLLRQELEVTMALAGCSTLSDINTSSIVGFKYE